MIKNIDKAMIESNNLKVTCLKILNKMPPTEQVRILCIDLKKEDRIPQQVELCLKVMTLMKNYLEMGLIKFGD